jgi:hypothetical protein
VPLLAPWVFRFGQRTRLRPALNAQEKLRGTGRLTEEIRHGRFLDALVGRMRTRGCALHVYYQLGAAHFVFSDDTKIPTAIGYALTKHPSLVAVDLPLLTGCLPQTFRYTDEEENLR